MTQEEQRIAIAEACGWKWYRRPATGPWAKKPYRSLYHPLISAEYVSTLQPADMTERQCNETFIWREGMIPDYLNDLNAMHEAVDALESRYWRQFIWWLEHMKNLGHVEDGCTQRDLTTEMLLIQATAAQRAEAFLRTIGLWKEDEKP